LSLAATYPGCIVRGQECRQRPYHRKQGFLEGITRQVVDQPITVADQPRLRGHAGEHAIQGGKVNPLVLPQGVGKLPDLGA
jgi:hypothetical protein